MFIIVPTPSLAFWAGVVEGHEPGGVQAFGPDLAVEGLRKGVVRRLARAAEVQGDAALIGPQIQVAGDKFRAVVDPYGLGITHHLAGPIKGFDNVCGLVGEAGIQGRREPAEGVDDRQNADLAPVEQLIVLEVHSPDVVGPGGGLTVLAQLCFDLALGRLVAHLQAQLLVKPIYFLAIDRPSLAFEQYRDPPVAVANPRLGDLFDPLLQGDRIGPLALVVIAGSFRLERPAGAPDADLPGRS